MTRGIRSVWKTLVLAIAFIAMENAETSPAGESRVTGRILSLDGNFMPTTNPGGPSGAVAPLSVPVYIFRGKVELGNGSEPASPRIDDSRIVGVIHADSFGHYEAKLPSGTYTVFALIDGRLYLNDFDGINHYTALEVGPGQVVRHDIQDNRKASF